MRSRQFQLIQEGAKLTFRFEDILSELPELPNLLESERNDSNEQPHQNSNAYNLVDCLDYTPTTIERIIEKSGLTPEQVSSMLIEVEISGQVVSDAYGHYTRI